MSKEQAAKRKEDILAQIKDPVVREHYRMQLDMAEEVEGDLGISTGFHESIGDCYPARPQPMLGVFAPLPRSTRTVQIPGDSTVDATVIAERTVEAMASRASRKTRRDLLIGIAVGTFWAGLVALLFLRGCG